MTKTTQRGYIPLPMIYRLQTTMLILSIGLSSLEANADPTNYQRYVIGERSLGMAGAYTAAVDDSMALYYNPGALAFADTTSVSGSKAVYAADYKLIQNGFVPNFGEVQNAQNLDTTNNLSWPSTLTFMTTFGESKGKRPYSRHALGFAMLVPYQEDFTFHGKYRENGSIVNKQTYYLAESYRVIWTGGGYSFRPTRRWGFGLSIFFSNYNYHRRYDSNYFDPPSDLTECSAEGCGEIEFTESDLKLKINSIIFRAGVLFKPSRRWRIGLSATAPSIFLEKLSEGSLDQTHGYASTSTPGDTYSYLFTDDYKLKVAGYEPASFRLGGAYVHPKVLTLDIDVSFHFPITYRRIRGNAVASRLESDEYASPDWFDTGIVRSIERLPVVNFNVGGEFIFKYGWSVRTGLFSDFSSAPEIEPSETPQLNRINHLGGAFSVGHKGKDHDITVGVIGTYGSGEASVYHPDLARAPGESPYQPTPYNDRTIIVFIAGVQKALEKKTKKIWKKIVD